MTPRVYTIPAGLSFVDALAKGIMNQAGDDPLSLSRMHILLPTRRACRSLRDAFLRLSHGRPLLLPRMNPIGDVDEEDLSIALSGLEDELSLPPAIPPIRRQFLLAKLIAAQGHGRNIEQDMLLASALGRLMDQVYTEDLDLANLPHAVERADFSQHWQISLDFLSILSQHWPLILAEQGVIDAADRRNRLLKKLAEHWQKSPPLHPVIAAGSTGSIPATSALLKVIASLPDGCVVLPGLDGIMDDESWNALDDTHPQATLRHLLKILDVGRKDVCLWPSCDEDSARKTIRLLASEIMRPSATAQEWQTLESRFNLRDEPNLSVERYDCANAQEEALVIALALRDALEDENKTAALVTPDRTLARRVAMVCRRWGINIDDSAGQSLADTRIGTYLRLCMGAVCCDMKPVALLDFCKHALCLPVHCQDWRGAIRGLDRFVFRGPSFEGGLKSYDKKVSALEDRGLDAKSFRHTLGFIEDSFKPLLDLAKENDPKPFAAWCDAHIRVVEKFCSPEVLWAGQDGEAASVFLSDLCEQADLLPLVTAEEYLSILTLMMKGVAVRPAYGLHPRLMILGQLEARLVEPDRMILAGLNEGTWPPDPGLDPWMSRQMRKRFGLPSLERSIGLSAHDFAQSLCAREVILTRSLRVDGTPTVPSRWLQRMDTVLKACGLSLKQGAYLDWARTIDHADTFSPVERPAPRPPLAARPRKLPVTKIDLWMNDPYSIYARYILKLKPLEPIERPLDAALRGTLVHKILDRFVRAYPDELPSDAQGRFMALAKEELDALCLEGDVRAFWEPRLAKIGSWVIGIEMNWRQDMLNISREDEGELCFNGPAGPFILQARADRIDQARDGSSGAIIDYKSAGSFTPKGMKNGQYPQLPLEALILEEGTFENTKRLPVLQLSYWVVNGAKEGGSIISLKTGQEVSKARENARAGLEKLIAVFDDESTPYYSLPRPEKAPRFNDYEQLARVLEWTALDDQGEAA